MSNVKKNFTNFKIHTQYSICEGATKIDDLASLCKEQKIKFGVKQLKDDPFNIFNGKKVNEELDEVVGKKKPLTSYAITKWKAEKLVMRWYKIYNFPAISLRFFNVYGPKLNTLDGYKSVFAGDGRAEGPTVASRDRGEKALRQRLRSKYKPVTPVFRAKGGPKTRPERLAALEQMPR